MDLGLAGKTALVTGGTRGLGRAIARRLAAEGCAVGIVARGAEAGEAAVAELHAMGACAHFVSADLGDRAETESAIAAIREALGPIGLLVFNNSGAPDAFRDEATDADHDLAYRLLVKSLGWCVDAVATDMRDAGWGRIVSIGSTCAREPHRAPFAMVLHNIARPAQIGLMKTLSTELAPFGITANTIAVGPFDHDGEARGRAYEHLARRGVATENLSQARLATIPAGRFGGADELAALCAFLCSDPAGFITGQTIAIDGGQGRSLM